MYSPGASGWIEKYIDLIEKNQINITQEFEESLILLGRDTGLLFGTAIRTVFIPEIETLKWTFQDQLKNVFFETLLWVHCKHHGFQFNKEKFIQDLSAFYVSSQPKKSLNFFSFLKSNSLSSKIESAIDERMQLDKRILETRIWLNTLHNAFVFLDAILFSEYLKSGNIRDFKELTEIVMHYFIGAAHSDKELSDSESKLFSYYIASARLNEKVDDKLEQLFNNPIYVPSLDNIQLESTEFKLFILYFCSFIITSNRELHEEEREFLLKIAKDIELSEDEVDLALTFNTAFILEHSKSIPYLGSSSSEILFSNLSKRWGKILLRNKDKLVLEIQQSKELMILLAKSTQKDLTKEEKELVKTQLMDIMKSMPSLAIFLIPGGSLLLPIFLKIIPGLLPSAFRDNEVTKD